MLNAILLVNKPSGISSASVVSKIKKKLNLQKIGHAGTLDPFATGLLVLLVNRATKLFPLFLHEDKKYEVSLEFGKATDTYDREGKVIAQNSYIPSAMEVEKILDNFIGEYEQEVPIYSAVKRGGKPLYKIARQGGQVVLPRRKVKFYEIKLLEHSGKRAKLFVHCSGGTYIRSLVNELGILLGTYAYALELKRLSSGVFDLRDAHSIETIEHNSLMELDTFFRKYYSDRLLSITNDEFMYKLEKVKTADAFSIFKNESTNHFLVYQKMTRIFI